MSVVNKFVKTLSCFRKRVEDAESERKLAELEERKQQEADKTVGLQHMTIDYKGRGD